MSETQRYGKQKRQEGSETKSSSYKGKDRTRKLPQKSINEIGEEGMGVSKIKAALRQTKRLLAKDNLSASVRQEAERKLIALQDDISAKETQQKERKNAQRSHKIRFFERQKLVRRIKKLKKSSEDENVGKELLEARVLLNYVLHYPMTQKYVALFPNQGPSTQDDEDDEIEEKEMNSSKEQSSKVKERIRQFMKMGELSSEPEMELELRTKEDENQSKPIHRKRLIEEKEKDEEVEPKKQKAKKEPKKSNLEGDDFFANEDE